MIASERSLTTAAVSGNNGALTDLLAQYDPDLRRWLGDRVGRRYRSAFDVDDVLQVTYLEAFLRIRQFSPDRNGTLWTWLKRIAENNLLDAIRELNRDKRPPRGRQVGVAPTDESYVTLITSLNSDETTPSIRAAKEEARGLLDTALGKLPADYEMVVRFYDLLGWSATEVAEEMGRSVGAVHMLKARAHERLAELLGASTKFFLGRA